MSKKTGTSSNQLDNKLESAMLTESQIGLRKDGNVILGCASLGEIQSTVGFQVKEEACSENDVD